jgi:hypothetical protein
MRLEKTNIEIIDIAHRIIERCKKDILDCKINGDTIEFILPDRKIIMSELYNHYYREDVIYNSGTTLSRLNLVNFCPSVNTIYEIDTNGVTRKEWKH